MNNETTEKRSNGFLKFLTFCACIAGIMLVIKKVFEYINRQDAQKNYNNEIRRYSACLTAIDDDLGNGEIKCIKLSSYFSAVKLDLRKADISSDLIVDISGVCSAVKLLVPANCNIVNVSSCASSAVEFDKERIFDAPTITLVGRMQACAISLQR